jgi:hypothetical protein
MESGMQPLNKPPQQRVPTSFTVGGPWFPHAAKNEVRMSTRPSWERRQGVLTPLCSSPSVSRAAGFPWRNLSERGAARSQEDGCLTQFCFLQQVKFAITPCWSPSFIVTLGPQKPVRHAVGINVDSADRIGWVVRVWDRSLTARCTGAGNIEGDDATAL